MFELILVVCVGFVQKLFALGSAIRWSVISSCRNVIYIQNIAERRVSILLSLVILQWKIGLLVVFIFAVFLVTIGSDGRHWRLVHMLCVHISRRALCSWQIRFILLFSFSHLLTNLKYSFWAVYSPVECVFVYTMTLGATAIGIFPHYLAFSLSLFLSPKRYPRVGTSTIFSVDVFALQYY